MPDDVIARTAQGRLRGTRDGQVLRFLGIPYAQPPVTAGRFAAPVPHGRWDGTRDALAYGATSPQPDRGITVIPEPIIAGDNELNLNVFTPELGAAGLPVLVWIHGGGFFGGGNASPWYHGGAFARDGVVLVSINYRLGAEGFLEIPGAPANRAVRDWVRALEWVQENIAAFGGDPGQVTIAGQSAGGSACAALLGVPWARGLFRRAVCMSGGAALQQTADSVRAVAAQMAGHLGVRALGRAILEELPAETILAAQQAGKPGRRRRAAGRRSRRGPARQRYPAAVGAVDRRRGRHRGAAAGGWFAAARQCFPAGEGNPGWDLHQTGRRPVMVFAEPSEVHEDPLQLEWTAWAQR